MEGFQNELDSMRVAREYDTRSALAAIEAQGNNHVILFLKYIGNLSMAQTRNE